MRTVIIALISVLWLLPGISLAQTASRGGATSSEAANQPPFDLNSSWHVTVTTSGRTFDLHLNGGAKGDVQGKTLLNATIDLQDRDLPAVSPEITETAQGRTLSFTTGLGGKIVAMQHPDGNFKGTMTLPNQIVLEVSIRKFTEQEMAEAQFKRDKIFVAIKPPAANVPATCAAFSGVWKGSWQSYGGQNGDPRWLWVSEISEKCVAKYAYQYGPNRPRELQSTEIKDGQLIAPCTKGTCAFKHRFGDLWVSYEGNDGSNATVFRRVTN